ncbi:MAG TPA: hypothetical protein PKA27_01445 [Fimbriimonadaceae bacterium]|nr:hypothetical protein [Fimbriimonadaceae bacterium]
MAKYHNICLGIGLGSLITIAYAYFNGPDVKTFQEAIAENERRDPKQGFPVPTVWADKGGDQPVLLIAAGNCNSCSLSTKRLSAALAKPFKVVIATTAKTFTNAILEEGTPHEVVQSDELLHKSVNAYFAPRLSILDKHGRILLLQARNETASDFLERWPRK